MTREQLETALDKNQLYLQGFNERWYRVRRNGMTKLWKRDTDRFRIPCKIGFKECFSIASSRFDGDITIDNPRLQVKL